MFDDEDDYPVYIPLRFVAISHCGFEIYCTKFQSKLPVHSVIAVFLKHLRFKLRVRVHIFCN